MRSGIIVLFLAASAVAGEPPGAYHEDPAWGFKVKVPKDWQHAAVSGTEWLACKHIGKRELEGRLEEGRYMTTERPEMWVLGFPHDKQGGGENPFADYKDFLSRNSDFIRFGDGYRALAEEEGTVDGAKVTMYEFRTGEKKRIGRHVVAWVYHYDDIDFVVQFKVLEWEWGDYASSFRGCLKSFRRIERTEALGGAPSAKAEIESRADLATVPAEKRARAFKDAVEAHLRKATADLPADWKSDREKNLLLLTNADDKKFVKATVIHAGAVESHLEKIFGESPMEYQPPFILRIYATEDQWRAAGGEREAGGLLRDISIYAGKGWVKDNSWEILNRALWSRWLEDRHPELEATLPAWLKEGMKKYMDMLRSKGRRVSFFNENWDRDEIRLQIKKENYEPLLTLMSRGIHGYGKQVNLEGYERERQERMVVLWLMTDGNRGKYKGLVRDFVVNVAIAIETFEKEWTGKNSQGKDAAEFQLQLHGAISAKRGEILKAAWERSFSKWKDKDWERLTNAWLSHAK